MIPESRKDMNDLKRDRRKRTLHQILRARENRMEVEGRLMDSINNPFGHKVKFEQVTDNKAVKDLMMAKARSAAGDGGEVSEEVKKLRMEKEREIQTYED
jgi:hypothetical protein